MTRVFVILVLLLLLMANSVAANILYIPLDNRPVCLEDPLTAIRAAGVRASAPPSEMLAGRGRDGDPDKLWTWLLTKAASADAVVVSTDALLYGGLVTSRVHQLSADVLNARLNNFLKLRAENPSLRIYVFSTVMRTPKMSAGGMDPAYFEQYGQQIFGYSGLRDKSEQHKLTQEEERDMANWFAAVPETAMLDWMKRRQINYTLNSKLLSLTQEGLFSYFILGRDDNARYSRTRQELRHLMQKVPNLSSATFTTFPGADQIGMVLLTRAVNDLTSSRPFVAVVYAPGTGPDTIPTYQGELVSESAFNHITAVGSYLIQSIERADLVLMVNTAPNGVTLEADDWRNTIVKRVETSEFAAQIAIHSKNKPVAVADIAFGNGADNYLLEQMMQLQVPERLAAYSGWNTASNTLGFAISHGLLSGRMSQADTQRIISVRLLDDWAYQANVRQLMKQEFLVPRALNEVQLGVAQSSVETETTARLKAFVAEHFGSFTMPEFRAGHPWKRMFEVQITLSER